MADMKPQGTQQYAVESGYESGDANVKSVIAGLGIIFAGTIVVMAAMFGMFNVLNGRITEQDEKIPVALTSRIVPPEPRLLPSPYTDEAPEAARLGQSTEDGYPWDKRNLEAGVQYAEANAYGKTQENTLRIPIERAMELEAGTPSGTGTPGIMAWQPEYPATVMGKTPQGELNLPGSAGKPKDEVRTFDKKPYWESPDEKYSVESSGGTLLQSGDLSR